MVNNPHFSDVQFQVDSGEVIYAHMFVLYARCPQAVQVVSTVDTLFFSDSVRPRLLTPTISAAAGSAQGAAGPNDKCLWTCSVLFFFVSGSQNPDKVVENVVLYVGRRWGGKDPSLHSAFEQWKKLPTCSLTLNFCTCTSAVCLVYLGVSCLPPRL